MNRNQTYKICKFNEAGCNIISTIDIFMNFLTCTLTFIWIIFRSIKYLFISPIFKGYVSKVIKFYYGTLWAFVEYLHISPYFFALLIFFPFKYMKTTLKCNQIIKFSKLFTSWFSPGIIWKTTPPPQKNCCILYLQNMGKIKLDY